MTQIPEKISFTTCLQKAYEMTDVTTASKSKVNNRFIISLSNDYVKFPKYTDMHVL